MCESTINMINDNNDVSVIELYKEKHKGKDILKKVIEDKCTCEYK